MLLARTFIIVSIEERFLTRHVVTIFWIMMGHSFHCIPAVHPQNGLTTITVLESKTCADAIGFRSESGQSSNLLWISHLSCDCLMAHEWGRPIVPLRHLLHKITKLMRSALGLLDFEEILLDGLFWICWVWSWAWPLWASGWWQWLGRIGVDVEVLSNLCFSLHERVDFKRNTSTEKT